MSEEAMKKFVEFDWSKSESWLNYFGKLYPTPEASKVLKWKKKWFKQNVDSSFDVDAPIDDPSSSSSSGSTGTSSTSSTPAPPSYSRPQSTPSTTTQMSLNMRIMSTLLLLCGMICTLIYILPIGLKRFFIYSVVLYVLGFVLDILATHGTPKLDPLYFQSALLEESGQTLFLTFAALTFKSWLGLVSPFLTSVIIFSNNYYLMKKSVPKAIAENKYVVEAAEAINVKRYPIMQARSNFEVVIGFVALIMIFFGKSSLMTIMLYWNALKFKYQCNAFTQAAFRNVDGHITSALTHSFCPPSINSGYCWIKTKLHSYVNPAQ